MLDPNPMATLRPAHVACCATCFNACIFEMNETRCELSQNQWFEKKWPGSSPRWSELMICDLYKPRKEHPDA